MVDATPAPGTGWEIKTQVSKVAPGPGGGLTQGYEVTFQTASGVLGAVFIPQLQYNVANVQAAVAAQALIMDQVAGLKG